MGSSNQEHKLLQLLSDALANMQEDCGCELTSMDITKAHAHINFSFQDEPYRMVIEKIGEAEASSLASSGSKGGED